MSIHIKYDDVERWYGSVSEFHYNIAMSLGSLIAASDYETALTEEEWNALITLHVGALNQMLVDMLEARPDLKLA